VALLATANALINCRTKVMKISFGNMTMELNIFDINKQSFDYDEVHTVCLIEVITNEVISEFSLEDLEIVCFAQYGGDVDFYRLLEPAKGVSEPRMEDTVLESFAQLGYDVDIVELVKQAETILDPIPKMQPKCGEITELSFPTPYSLAV
jgi:hypothetical protein